MRLFVALMVLAVVQPPVRGEEPAKPKTTLHVYHVSDLVTDEAMMAAAGFRRVKVDDWHKILPETLDALSDLEETVEAMCEGAVVKTYPRTLSLIVRHSTDGHQQVAELLAGLRSDDAPAAVRVEFQPLCLGPLDGGGLEVVEEAQAALGQAMARPKLSGEEAARLKKLFPVSTENAGVGLRKYTVDISDGRRLSWGLQMRPATVMARLVADRDVAALRIDAVVDGDDNVYQVATNTLALGDGESSIYQQHCGGESIYWLVTVKMKTAAAGKANKQVAAVLPQDR